MYGFRYQIGDTLTHRSALVEPVPNSAPRLFVVERVGQECPGGTQFHYRCRGTVAGETGCGVASDLELFLQEEVCLYAEYAAAWRVALEQAQVEEMQRILKVEEMRGRAQGKKEGQGGGP